MDSWNYEQHIPQNLKSYFCKIKIFFFFNIFQIDAPGECFMQPGQVNAIGVEVSILTHCGLGNLNEILDM